MQTFAKNYKKSSATDCWKW